MNSDKANTLEGLRINRPATPERSGRGWLLPVGIILLLIAGLAFWLLRGPAAVDVQTATAQAQATGSGSGPGGGNQRTLLDASGYVTARRLATVSSKVTGRVMEVLVEEGMKVEQGQVLARLDQSNVEAGLKLAEAQLESVRCGIEETRPALAFARRELERFQTLYAGKAASDADLNKARSEAEVAQAKMIRQEADLRVAEREVATWKQQMDDAIIRAPFTAIVTSKNAQPGEIISPISAGGGFTRTGICTLVDMDSLEIEVDVNESYINRVQPGQPVEARLDAYAGWRIPAKVIAIIPTADRQKATVKVRVGFEKLDPRILPDMGVKVAFQAVPDAAAESAAPAGSATVSVPKAAVQEENGRSIVWIVREGRAERRAVTVAQTLDSVSLISAGLTGGESVVVQMSGKLTDGSRVKESKP